jgi:hypothetical protein
MDSRFEEASLDVPFCRQRRMPAVVSCSSRGRRQPPVLPATAGFHIFSFSSLSLMP